MKRIRILLLAGILILAAGTIAVLVNSQTVVSSSTIGLIASRNVNMVSGTKLPLGDPWLQRQNEPSIAVSSRNPMHLFAAANDYRTIDMPDDYSLPGIPGASAVRDSWIGVFESFNGGESSVTMLLPGFPQDTSAEGVASPIHGFDTACDPIVRAGARGLFYLSGIAFNRNQQQGAVFVARYVDFNNRENVEEEIDQVSGYKKYVGPIKYIDTKAVDRDTQRRFIDMPNMAVDVPRGGAPYGNIYVAYTVFLGDTTKITRSRIILVRSSDGGVTWTWPTILSEFQYLVQRPVIVIDPSDPTGKTIYVVFRRFALWNKTDGIGFVKSVDGGKRFSGPADIATLPCPFDQATTNTSFRTNSYPTMAVDGNGIVYVAWAQRYGQNGLPNPNGQARIVISYSQNRGLTWSAPRIVDPSYQGDGHQFMPTMTFGGGKLKLAWYDQRDDISLHHPNTKFIEDEYPTHRHMIDVRAAEGTPGAPPIFQSSIPVSRYLYFMQLDESGEPIKGNDGNPLLWQGQYNFINFPLFHLGTKPFHGDYMEIASSPQILPPPATASNSWVFNTSSSEPTTSTVVWSDTRDVWPPAGNIWGDWINYNPPTSLQEGDFEQQNPCGNTDTTGMRNQNVYTANLNYGVIVGSPGNTKQLDIQRTFVVFVKNTTEYSKSLSLTISPSLGVPASFEQFSSQSSLEVTVPPYSSVSSTVYVGPSGSNNGFGSVRVDVTEGGSLVGRVFLNPDSTNNPILDPDGNYLGNESHNPIMSNPKVWKYYVGSQNEPNASFLSPRAQNPRAQNSGYVNPRAQNEGILNPRAQNPRAQNPRAQNENIVNNEMYNPRAQNPRAQNTALTDMTWTVSNDGNTTSAYSFNIVSNSEEIRNLFNQVNPPLIAQVLVYKVHTVPIDNACQLLQTHADELIINVTNPRAQNPRAQNTAPTARNITTLGMNATTQQNSDTQDITFNLAPGEEAEVTFRVYDPDTTDPFSFDGYINSFAGETEAEAANTGDTAPKLVTQPDVPWATPLPKIGCYPASLSFEAGLGANPPDQTITINNLGEGTLNYTISDDAGWLSVSPSSGTSHTVSVNIAGLTPDSYSGTITITGPYATNNPVRVPVTLNLYAILAHKLVFTQSPSGGVGGAPWTDQVIVEVQDAAGDRITSDNSSQVTLAILNNPGHGLLSGPSSMTVTAGVAAFNDLSINKGGWGYTLEATSNLPLTPATSEPFGIEGFSETKNPLVNVMKWQTATPVVSAGADRVLIAGGLSADGTNSLSDICFYNPSTNEFEYPGKNMNQARYLHTATSLLDGTVLFVGGYPIEQSAEIFDLATGDFTSVSNTINPHAGHRATLLQDGRVLVTGDMGTNANSAEIYDPQTGTFVAAEPMNHPRNRHTSTLLPNGKVLITGGYDRDIVGASGTAELFDPATGVFTEITGGMAGGVRVNHQATLLDNGMVLITGGSDGSTPKLTAEIYDPTSTDSHPNGRFQQVGNMLYGRERHQAALLRDGTVLLIGGSNSSASNEIYDPSTSTFRATGPMSTYRLDGAAAVLPDGRVLITGGYIEEGVSGTGEVWNPLVPFPTHVISGTITPNGTGAAVRGIMLVGLPGHPLTNYGGYYEGLVLSGWSGTVTPTKPGYTFNPPSIAYSNVTSKVSGQDYSVASAPAVPVKLAFAQQPSNTAAGATITPAVTVEIQDAAGNLVTTATNTVKLSLRNAGSATLSGDIDKDAVGGIATFDDLSISTVGTGYLLRANSGSLTEVDSSAFNITGGTTSKIQVETKSDGSGTIVPAQNVPNGSMISVYAISRDAGGIFIANEADGSWSLVNKTGGVVDGDLAPWEGFSGAFFVGNLPGTAQIHVAKTGFTSVDSGVLTVTPAPLGLTVSVGSANSFDVIVDGVMIGTVPNDTTQTYSLSQLVGSHSVILRNKGDEDTIVSAGMIQNSADYLFSTASTSSGIWDTFNFTEAEINSLFHYGYVPPHVGDFSFTYTIAYKTKTTYQEKYEFVTKWGSYGTGDGEFNNPSGIAVDSNGYIYVADTYNHRIQKFDSGRNFVTKWGSYGSGVNQFNTPYSIAVDSSNYLYVADSGNDRVQKCDSSGNFVGNWGSSGTGDSQFDDSAAVAIDSSGNVYVVDTFNHRIQKFTSNGGFLGWWGRDNLGSTGWHGPGFGRTGAQGSGDGEFSWPRGIAVDSLDNVYVTDQGNFRIQKFTSSGTFVTKWGSEGTGDRQFKVPWDIAADSSNNVYVADDYNSRIQKFTSSGTFVTKWGTYGTGDGQFDYPWRIVVDSSGYVYVTDAYNNRIQKFRKKYE
jgi:hypothetical protein